MSSGLPKLREAVAALYQRNWGVELDPETGDHQHDRLEGGLQPPDVGAARTGRRGRSCRARATRSTSTARCSPVPTCARCRCGTATRATSTSRATSSRASDRAYDIGWPKPRCSSSRFPHNPTGARVDLAFMQRSSTSPRARDDRRARLRLRRRRLRRLPAAVSILQAEGRQGVRRRAVLDDEELLDGRAGACAFMSGNAEVVQALVKLKSYLDYGTFQPIQIAATVTMNEASDYPQRGVRDLPEPPRRAVRGSRPHRLGLPEAQGTMFVWAGSPSRIRAIGPLEFAPFLVQEGEWRRRPASVRRRGDQFVRFAPDRERAAHQPGRAEPPAKALPKLQPRRRPPSLPLVSLLLAALRQSVLRTRGDALRRPLRRPRNTAFTEVRRCMVMEHTLRAGLAARSPRCARPVAS